jgi:predicted DNA-binding WGR domain protein
MAYVKPTDRNKPWAKRQMPEKRELKRMEVKNLFRIYCEGENTEPEYFRSFPVNTETRVEAIGLGRSRTALVEKTIELLSREKLLKRQKEYDKDRQLWVVFDYDIRREANEAFDYNNAIDLAQKHGIKVAYSNDSFELWFVLHDQYHNTAITRIEYYQKLSEKLNCNYGKEGKSKEFVQRLYHIFLPQQQNAIQNATRLFQEKEQLIYSDQNPCTTVFQLVEELNKCIKK